MDLKLQNYKLRYSRVYIEKYKMDANYLLSQEIMNRAMEKGWKIMSLPI